MASRKTYLTRPNYVFLRGEQSSNNQETGEDTGFEFDESDVWSSGQAPTSPDHFKKPIPSSRASKKPASKKMEAVTATSLPVNIPDWSKILRDDYRMSRRKESDEGVEDSVAAEDDGHDSRIPPHEYLARTRVASFSVHEGIGRTLKGRDLSRVRNAIWKTVGFED